LSSSPNHEEKIAEQDRELHKVKTLGCLVSAFPVSKRFSIDMFVLRPVRQRQIMAVFVLCTSLIQKEETSYLDER